MKRVDAFVWARRSEIKYSIVDHDAGINWYQRIFRYSMAGNTGALTSSAVFIC